MTLNSILLNCQKIETKFPSKRKIKSNFCELDIILKYFIKLRKNIAKFGKRNYKKDKI